MKSTTVLKKVEQARMLKDLDLNLTFINKKNNFRTKVFAAYFYSAYLGILISASNANFKSCDRLLALQSCFKHFVKVSSMVRPLT